MKLQPINHSADHIEIHIRTYRSLLKSAGLVEIDKLIDSHKEMNSILHSKAKSNDIDAAAFIYSLLRLPSVMSQVKKIILGQSITVFKTKGFGHIESWKEVEAPGRRRKMYFDGKNTLAVYIASVTDVDDLITLLTAFQIEWNKMHQKLKNAKDVTETAEKILITEDRQKIENIWGEDYQKFLTAIKFRKIEFTVHLLSGSYMEYSRATQHWWNHIEKTIKNIDLFRRPVYFVSSNTHSLTNLITRFVLDEERTLVDYLYKSKDEFLINLWQEIQSGKSDDTKEFFLYYIAKKALRGNRELFSRKTKLEQISGIQNITSKHFLDIDAQIIPLSSIAKSRLGELISIQIRQLEKSKAVIINIDYPLGWAAYQVLTEIGQNAGQVKGIFIMGKAATLNGQIGDILLPNVIFDQHTKNIYGITNCFRGNDFQKIFKAGSVLDNQKNVSTKGTFLENNKMIEKWFSDGYTIIEMESGPYLNAVYEFVYYDRYEENQFINLTQTPFELGLIHYASDTPYSKAKNLGVKNLSYEGVESTYAATLVILKKIIKMEIS